MELDIDNTEDSTGVFPNELDAKLSLGWSLIDVREDDEWTYGHHEEAKHVKMSEVPESLELFDQESSYIIVCRSGHRSGKVSEYLNSIGYQSYNLIGGMKKLSNESNKIIGSDGNPGIII